MHSFQQGDKVRHKNHGHVLDVLSVDGDELSVGFTYADAHVCEWPVNEVELYVESKAFSVNERKPTEADGDFWGDVLVRDDKGWHVVEWYYAGDDEEAIWMHTPERLQDFDLHVLCDDCDYADVWHEGSEMRFSSFACNKFKIKNPVPFYKNGVPCHLVEVES